SRQVEWAGEQGVAATLMQQAQRDLLAFQRVFELSAQTLWQWTREIVATVLPALADAWVPWCELAPANQQGQRSSARELLCQHMATCSDWSLLVEPLTRHWTRYGTGQFGRFPVLRWHGHEQGLCGVPYPDGIRLVN